MRIVRAWRWFALAAAALVPYAHSLGYGFVDFDDQATIVELPLIRHLSWQTLPDFFKPDIYAALYEYMPLKNLSYAADFALFGTSGPALRPQQYFWYIASVVALFAWLRGLLRRLAEVERLGVSAARAEWIAFVASILFALHPAHVESVVWLSSLFEYDRAGRILLRGVAPTAAPLPVASRVVLLALRVGHHAPTGGGSREAAGRLNRPFAKRTWRQHSHNTGAADAGKTPAHLVRHGTRPRAHRLFEVIAQFERLHVLFAD